MDFLTPYKRRRTGICSAFFRSLEPEKQVPIWIKTGLFRLPGRDQHMLLIGPGTGLAAMRAILQERAVLRAAATAEDDEDAAVGDTHVYFGARHEHMVHCEGGSCWCLSDARTHSERGALLSFVIRTFSMARSCRVLSSLAISRVSTRRSLATRCALYTGWDMRSLQVPGANEKLRG